MISLHIQGDSDHVVIAVIESFKIEKRPVIIILGFHQSQAQFSNFLVKNKF